MARMRQQPGMDKGWTEAEAASATRSHLASPCRKPSTAEQDERRRRLLKFTVEADVIPRLIATRQTEHPETSASLPSPAEQVEGLVDLLLNREPPASADFVQAMRDLGASAESLYVDLLTPAARRIGVLWEEDLCDFSEVTIALFRLHSIMRNLAPAFVGMVDKRAAGPRALLIQMPGEQHGMGIAMVAQYFTREGWDVCTDPVETSSELLDRVRREYFDLVGISLSCSDRIDSLAEGIRAIRRLSRNPGIGIMVGGAPFIGHPQLADLVGADATATDGQQAVRKARQLISVTVRER